VNIPRLRWRAFMLGALLAGLGGALWGHFITSFSPRAFFLKETFLVLSMLVIGGAATVSGAVLGTLLVSLVFEGLRAVEAMINKAQLLAGQVVGLTEIVLALAMMIFLVLRPDGLCGRAEIGWVRRRPEKDN
jgi:branched-chain amino acid transport system permease protein